MVRGTRRRWRRGALPRNVLVRGGREESFREQKAEVREKCEEGECEKREQLQQHVR